MEIVSHLLYLLILPSLCFSLSEEFYPYGSDVDDVLDLSDDASSTSISLIENFVLLGVEYTSLYINTDGILSFASAIQYNSSIQSLSSLGPVIAPLWSDVESGVVYYRTTEDALLLNRSCEMIGQHYNDDDFKPTLLMIATWVDVGYYNSSKDLTNTFQTVLVTDGVNSFVIFLYSELQWAESDSKSSDIPRVFAGFADSSYSFLVPGSDTEQILQLLTENSNIGLDGVFLYNVANQTSGCIHGNVRLQGNVSTEGRVEVCANNIWGTICETDWNDVASTVVCIQLGLPSSGAQVINSADTPDGSGDIWLESVSCSDTSTRILDDCSNAGVGVHSCAHQNDIGVKCTGFTCKTGDLNLIVGAADYEGRVEICNRNAWGTICDDSWDDVDATVVCIQLGLTSTYASTLSTEVVTDGTGPIWLSGVQCSYSNTRLIDCPNEGVPSSPMHSQDIGVSCPNCIQGDIRLQGGNSTSGRVEICNQNVWGTVCDDFWTTSNAIVVCRELGFSTTGAAVLTGGFVPGIATIWLDDVKCTGNEMNLTSCSAATLGTHDCTHSEDVGVICPMCVHGEVRLEGGSNVYGRVEVCNDGVWGTVCNTSWNGTSAGVVCAQLGLDSTGATALTSNFTQGIGDIWLDNILCTGVETKLLDCSTGPLETNDCGGAGHSADAGVRCLGFEITVLLNCTDGDLRLQGGNSTQGIVEVCHGNKWGTICNSRFGTNEAKVICRQLGFPENNGATPLTRAFELFGSVNNPIIPMLSCTGREPNILDCPQGNFLVPCDHTMTAGVQCYDEDQCSNNNGGCQQKCTNLIPDYNCSCNTGYTLNEDGLSCDDIDECAEGAEGAVSCNHTCVNTNGSYFCGCDDGYVLQDNFNCRACVTGEVRLVNGTSLNEGRVEVCDNGVYYTVCDDNWDELEAQVVCTQLGYSSSAGSIAVRGAHYGKGNGSIILDNLLCNGSESDLIQCPRMDDISLYGSDCMHSEDAGVICESSCIHGNVRLAISDDILAHYLGETDYNPLYYDKTDLQVGRVEVCLNGAYGAVCNSKWGNQEASVVCGQLGFSECGAVAVAADLFNEGLVPQHFMEINCLGNETSLLECGNVPFNGINCPTSGVICQDLTTPCQSCETGDIQLSDFVETELTREGRVEVCINRAWGSVCDSLFDEVDAETACSNLTGFSDRGATILTPDTFQVGTGPIFLAELKCDGTEGSLLYCPTRYHAPPGMTQQCNHSQDVGVQCSDINECQEMNDVCEQNCSNTIGSYNCSCVDGFRLDMDGYSCSDIDECFEGLDICDFNATCNNTEGDYNCSCDPGYDGDGFICDNIDECETQDHNCHEYAICEDTDGHFLCNCTTGFEGNGTDCRDIDECSNDTLNDCHTLFAICTNTPGDHTCECFGNFDGDGINCTDIDECLSSPCDVNADCINTNGSFECQCFIGYEGDGFNCSDIDQCDNDMDNDCDIYAECINIEGLYNCSCQPGYRGNGTENNCNCTDGDVLLMNGSSPSRGQAEGRVEICYNNLYWTICDDYWDVADARVICRQLGFTGTDHFPIMRASTRYGNGSGEILLDNLMCSGQESSLFNCPGNEIWDNNCDHSEDAGVVCNIICDDGYTRLVNDNPLQGDIVKDTLRIGRVEMCLEGEFRTICDADWNDVAASVLCSELGFSKYGAIGLRESAIQISLSPVTPGFTAVNCTGTESSLRECAVSKDAVSSGCGTSAVVCQELEIEPGICTDGELRLMNGTELEGRLDICINNAWGTVCSNKFDSSDARVACRRLGLLHEIYGVGVPSVQLNSKFQEGDGPIFLDGLECDGDEDDLLSCRSSALLGIADCFHTEDVGITCPDKDRCAIEQPCNSTRNEVCEYALLGYNCVCPSGYKRHQNQSCININECANLTEYCPNGSCTDLNPGYVCLCNAGFIQVDNTTCLDIDECSNDTIVSGCDVNSQCVNYGGFYSCECLPGFSGNGSVGFCEDMDECTVNNMCDDNALCNNSFGSFGCQCLPGFTGDGFYCNCTYRDVRLVDDSHDTHSFFVATNNEDLVCQYRVDADEIEVTQCSGSWTMVLEGRVEICIDNQYGTVCDDRWDELEATVVCRQLQHTSTNVFPIRQSVLLYGNGTGDIVLDDLDCNSTESTLLDCQEDKNNRDNHDCTHSEDAGVRCGALCEDNSVRILRTDSNQYYGGDYPIEESYYIDDNLATGRIEVCHAGQWRAVCKDSWSGADTAVACNQLGFSRAGAINGSGDFRNSGDALLPLRIERNCTGMEANLNDCPYVGSTEETCAASDNVYIVCQALGTAYSDCEDGEVRLTGGLNVREGRVEICFNKAWGTVCSTRFSNVDAAVACSSMDFDKKGALFVGTTSMMDSNVPIFLSDLRCDSTIHDELVDCDSNSHGIPDRSCSHQLDVKIHCEAHCPQEMNSESNYGSYLWMMSLPSTSHELPCVHGGENSNSQARRMCNERGIWEDTIFSECWTLSEMMLNPLQNVVISPSNINGILNEISGALNLANSSDDETIFSLNIITSALTSLFNCTECTLGKDDVDMLVDTINSVQTWNEETLSSESAKLLDPDSIEDVFGKFISETSGPLNFTRDSTALYGIKRSTQELNANGVAFAVSTENGGLSGSISNNGSNDESLSIVLPSNLFSQTSNDVSILFGAYASPNLFIQAKATNFEVASSIITAKILHEHNIIGNQNPVTIAIPLLSETSEGSVCVFWDKVGQDWSTEGCITGDKIGKIISCECNHLSTFGILVNTDPVDCGIGLKQNINATECEPLDPEIEINATVTQENAGSLNPDKTMFTIYEGNEMQIACSGVGEFPEVVTWLILNETSQEYENILEIDANLSNSSVFSLDYLSTDQVNVLQSEISGQLYAYRYRNDSVVLGTRSAAILGVDIGVGSIANGTYRCRAENANSSTEKTLRIEVRRLEVQPQYVRFSTKSFEEISQEYLHPNNENTDDLVSAMFSTALLKSHDTSPLVTNCSIVPSRLIEQERNWTRLECWIYFSTELNGDYNSSTFSSNLPSEDFFQQGFNKSDKGFCNHVPNFVSHDNRGNYTWNETEVGKNDTSECFYEPLRSEGGMARLYCLSHLNFSYDGEECVTYGTFRLRELSRKNITAEVAAFVLEEVATVVDDFDESEQREDNLEIVADIYGNIGDLVTAREFNATEDVTMSTVSTLNSLSIWEPDILKPQSSGIVNVFETINLNLLEQSFNESVILEEYIRFEINKVESDRVSISEFENYVTIKPPSNNITEETAFISVPENRMNSSFIYTLYTISSLFQVVPPENVTNYTYSVDTAVLGFTAPNLDTDSSNPVRITLQSLHPEEEWYSPVCVSWNFTAIDGDGGNWSERGCRLDEQATNLTAGTFVCECQHLTNFAVLVSSKATESNPITTTLSIIGCVISIICLLLCIFTLVYFKNIRQKDASKIHVQLCLALLLLYLAFAIGIGIRNHYVCTGASLIIQYFALASVFWMGAEAVLMIKKLVVVFGKVSRRFLIILTLCCWVIPAVFPLLASIISLGINTNYLITRPVDSDGYCFISHEGVLYGLFLAPLYIMVIFNTIAFVLVIRVILKHRNTHPHLKSNRSRLAKTIVIVFCMMSMFGLFWLIGAATAYQATVFFEYPFIILNTSQGLLLFVFIVLMNGRDEWMSFLTCPTRRKPPVLTKNTKNTTSNCKVTTLDSRSKETSFQDTMPRPPPRLGSESSSDSHVVKSTLDPVNESNTNGHNILKFHTNLQALKMAENEYQ